jgi:hypothetical protein
MMPLQRRSGRTSVDQRHSISGDNPVNLIGAMNEIRIIPIAGNLIYRIAANRAFFQVIQDFQFLVEIQLFVKQLNQLFKAACVHSASQSAFTSNLW